MNYRLQVSRILPSDSLEVESLQSAGVYGHTATPRLS